MNWKTWLVTLASVAGTGAINAGIEYLQADGVPATAAAWKGLGIGVALAVPVAIVNWLRKSPLPSAGAVDPEARL